MPAPSHSSGTNTPNRPRLARPFRAAFGKVADLSQAAACGATSRCTKSRTASRICSCSDESSANLHSFEHAGDALAAADAHGHHRVALVGALQFVERPDGEDAAGRTDRMAERDRAAVGIHL